MLITAQTSSPFPMPLAKPILSMVEQNQNTIWEPHLPHPECFSREAGLCFAFLMLCSVIFELQPSSFPSDRSKVAYVILLSGKAKIWATAEWEGQSSICSSIDAFSTELCKVFDSTLQYQRWMSLEPCLSHPRGPTLWLSMPWTSAWPLGTVGGTPWPFMMPSNGA